MRNRNKSDNFNNRNSYYNKDSKIEKLMKDLKKKNKGKKLYEWDIPYLVDFEEGFTFKLTQEIGKDAIKTSQLRKIFDSIKSIEQEIGDKDKFNSMKNKFYLIKPKLAYANKRNLISSDFYYVLMYLMSKVEDNNNDIFIENFKSFVNILESIVAYHKFNY